MFCFSIPFLKDHTSQIGALLFLSNDFYENVIFPIFFIFKITLFGSTLAIGVILGLTWSFPNFEDLIQKCIILPDDSESMRHFFKFFIEFWAWSWSRSVANFAKVLISAIQMHNRQWRWGIQRARLPRQKMIQAWRTGKRKNFSFDLWNIFWKINYILLFQKRPIAEFHVSIRVFRRKTDLIRKWDE